MRSIGKFRQRIPSTGMLALAAFVICVASGIMLVPAYFVASPLDSLALLSLKNPAGLFVRTLHYWSAQAFFVFTLTHIVDHILRRSEKTVRFGVWLRLSLTIPVVVAAMLSGFLLRGDAAAIQALPVLRSLLGFIPIMGAGIRDVLTGGSTDLSVIYIHHACTATLVIWLITIEHSRQIMPTARSIAWITPLVLLFSFVLLPGLEWRTSSVEKGPWYLIGLQELLHWLPRPQTVLWLGGIGLGMLALLPKLPIQINTAARWALAFATLLYAGLSIVGLGFRGDGWCWMSPRKVLADESDFLSYRAYSSPTASLIGVKVPVVDGRREGCLSCHNGMTGFVTAHDPATIGCTSCHLGNPWTLDKKLAHSGMTLTPGNLSIVDQTCGASNCHTDQVNRVRLSLMNTMSGVVAVDKYAFGENTNLNAIYAVAALGYSPADTHLRNLCASCHLGQDKTHPGPISETDRGGGCSACHLNYDAATQQEFTKRSALSGPLHHPDISIHVPNTACFGCHSRSGRISTNYEGWHETLLNGKSASTSAGWPAKFRVLSDGRIFEKHTADIHAEKGMNCVDCHLASEIMGDGSSHAHEHNAIEITCVDCHAAGKTFAKEFAQVDPETQQIVAMRKLNVQGRRFVTTASTTLAYPNVFLNAAGQPVVLLANSAAPVQPKPMSQVCAGDIHERLTCTACHTAWSPQCISCHTSFDRKTQGWDHIAGKFVDGSWNETPDGYLSNAPALGVERAAGGDGKPQERITTFVPGMILNLTIPESNGKDRVTFQRLFAPSSSHTVTAHARDCRSCHANPAALGYGRGQLKYVVSGGSGRWQFTPAYSRSLEDGLPLDAWIGCLEEPRTNSTTRKEARPFTLEEQRKILLVGACLACHSEKDHRIIAVFANFTNYRSALSPKCAVPEW